MHLTGKPLDRHVSLLFFKWLICDVYPAPCIKEAGFSAQRKLHISEEPITLLTFVLP